MKSLAQHPFFVSDTARVEAGAEERRQLELSWLLPLSAEQARSVLAAAEKGDYEAVQSAGLWSLGRANLAAHLCASGADFLDVLVSDLSATDLRRLSQDLAGLHPEAGDAFAPEKLERPLLWLLQSYAESAEQLLRDLKDGETRLAELRGLKAEAAPLGQLFLDALLAKFDGEVKEQETTTQKEMQKEVPGGAVAPVKFESKQVVESAPVEEGEAGGIRVVTNTGRTKTGFQRFEDMMERGKEHVPVRAYVKKGVKKSAEAISQGAGKVASKSAERVKTAGVAEKTAEKTAETKTFVKKQANTFRDQVRKQRDSLAERAAQSKEQREKELAERKAELEQQALARRAAEEEAARIAEEEKRVNPRAIRVPTAEELQEERRATLPETAPTEAEMEPPAPKQEGAGQGVSVAGGAGLSRFAPARKPTAKAKRDFAPPKAPRRAPQSRIQGAKTSPVGETPAKEVAPVATSKATAPAPAPAPPPPVPVTPSIVKTNTTVVRPRSGMGARGSARSSATRGWQVAGLLAFLSTAPESLFKGGRLIPSAVPILLLVVAILLLLDSRTRRTAPPPAEPQPVATEVAFAFTTQPGGPEEQPQVGVGNLLSLNEVRYCLYQEQRLQLIREQVNPHSDYETTRYNHEIDDYNQRCLEFRHPQGAVRTVRQEIPEWRENLIRQSENIIQGWRTSSTSQ